MSPRPGWAQPVRVAVVGCGTVVDVAYLPALRHLQRLGWVGPVRFFDVVPERAVAASRALPASRAASSWASLLEAPDELAIVASPPSAHAEQVDDLLRHGKHVLCEKPFTLTRASAAALARSARAAERICAVGMVRRFSRPASFLRSLLSSEARRGPGRIRWYEGDPFRWPIHSTAWFRGDPGTRLLWDIGSHVVDLLVWWLGAPESVSCRTDAMGGVEANCLLELGWSSGWSGEVRLSRDWSPPGGLVLELAHGQVRCPDVFEDRLVWRPSAEPWALTGALGGGDGGAVGYLPCLIAQLHDVLDGVRTGRLPRVPAESVLEGIGCLEAADAGRGLLESPWLSPEELERARAPAPTSPTPA
jgi:predicted dehydrogenase